MEPNQCQIQDWPQLSQGNLTVGPLSLQMRMRVLVKRYFSPKMKRMIKQNISKLAGLIRQPDAEPVPPIANHLQAGDLVRVKSADEIKATLDMWNNSKGCGFMPSMWQYCDTQQRVLKPVRNFLDERDYRMKKTRGIVLLEGLMCQGIEGLGACDRSCLFFWREEWLEKIEAPAERADVS